MKIKKLPNPILNHAVLLLLFGIAPSICWCLPPGEELTPAEIGQTLSSKKWVLIIQIKENAGMTIINYMARVPTCQKDDEFHFKPNGTYSVRGGEVRCHEDEAEDLGHGNWQINSKGELVQDYLGGKPYTRSIDRIDASKLVLTVKNSDGSTTKWVYKALDKQSNVSSSETNASDKPSSERQKEETQPTQILTEKKNEEETTTPPPNDKINEPSPPKRKWLAFKAYALGGYRTLKAKAGHYVYEYVTDNGLDFYDSVCFKGSSGGFGYNLGIEWEHPDQFYLQLGFNGISNEINAQGLHTGLGLIAGKKKVQFKPGLSLTWQYARVPMNEMKWYQQSSDTYSEIVIDGVNFIDGIAYVDLIQRSFGFQPQIALDVQMRGSWGFRANVGGYIPIKHSSRLEISGRIGKEYNEETDEWEDKYETLTQRLDDHNVKGVRFNGQPTDKFNIQLLGVHAQVGVYYSFNK